MSVQVQIHVMDSSVEDRHLYALGAKGGPLASLKYNDSFDDAMDVVNDLDSFIVGSTRDDWVMEVQEFLGDTHVVDDVLIDQMKVIIGSYDDANDDVLDWLDDKSDEEIFTVGY